LSAAGSNNNQQQQAKNSQSHHNSVSSDHENSRTWEQLQQQQQQLYLTGNYVPMTARHCPTADYEPMQFERSERACSEVTTISGSGGDESCDGDDDASGLSSSQYSLLPLRGAGVAQCDPATPGGEQPSTAASDHELYCNIPGLLEHVGRHSEEKSSCSSSRSPSEFRRSASLVADASGAHNYDTVDSMDIMSDRYL
jgi:hypothetical protein